MTGPLRACLVALALCSWGVALGRQAPPTPLPVPFAGRTAGLLRQEGFLPLYLDMRRGQVLLEVARLGEEFLYGTSIAGGAGLVEAHLDRGQLDDLGLCRFERAGGRVLLHQVQTANRAGTPDPAARRAVEESFPSSVRAALPIIAEEGGRLLVDATELVLRDPMVAGHLAKVRVGEFRLDRDRSALLPERTSAFPRNTEIEALLTFAAERPSRAIANVLPDERTMSVRVHHSFMQLPPPGFVPRPLDVRVGFLPLAYRDYTSPSGASLERQLASRWRLRRKDPGARISEPLQPIVLYLDRAIPEPERSAVRAGVLWWNEAFAAAGYRNAITVRDLPDGASFLDVRYSGIAWVHRTDRGWSSGEFRQDPRTGEILHAVVRLDSHRRRTVSQLWQALRPPPRACAAADAPDLAWPASEDPDGRALVLARLSYLAAHEVGHVLGLAHHFAASQHGFGSVMDYYAPNLRLVDGRLDTSDAYPRTVGPYDRLAIRWGYGDDDGRALEGLLRDAMAQGLVYTLPGDARWVEYDFGPDPVAFLREALSVRRLMLQQFGSGPARPGESTTDVGSRFSLAYLHHRAGLQAVAAYVGGQYQVPARLGSPLPAVSWVPAERQREALQALLGALDPEELDVPDRALEVLLPSPGEGPHGRWESGATFSPLHAARSLAALIAGILLQPERAARLTFQALSQSPHLGPSAALTLPEVLAKLVQATWGAPTDRTPRHQALRRVAQRVVLEALVQLLERPESAPEVRAQVYGQLLRLRRELAARRAADPQTEAHLRLCERDLAHALERHDAPHSPPPPGPIPPVRPLGG